MANPEHVQIAKSGSEQWNAWRQANRHLGAPDLSGADLTEVELTDGLCRALPLRGRRYSVAAQNIAYRLV